MGRARTAWWVTNQSAPRTFSVILLLALVLTVLPIRVVVNAHTECTSSGSNPTVIKGDDHDSICNGAGGYDSMLGYGGNDNLGGGGARDAIRGAFGNDSLHDTGGNGDNDRFCGGAGENHMNSRDGDANDYMFVYLGPGGGQNTLTRDTGDGWENTAESCPSWI